MTLTQRTWGPDEDEHAPWSYTEFGVLCACGSAMDSDENCLRLQRLSENIRRFHDPDWVGIAVRGCSVRYRYPLGLPGREGREGTKR